MRRVTAVLAACCGLLWALLSPPPPAQAQLLPGLPLPLPLLGGSLPLLGGGGGGSGGGGLPIVGDLLSGNLLGGLPLLGGGGGGGSGSGSQTGGIESLIPK